MFSSIKVSKAKQLLPLKSPIELLFESIAFYKEYFWILLGYTAWMIVPIVAYFILSFFPTEQPIVWIASVFVSFVELLIAFWIGIILTIVISKLLTKQKLDIQALQTQTVLLIRPVVLVSILHLLIVLGGALLLIIPGIIFLVWYSFSHLAVILDEQFGTHALTFSRNLIRGRFFRTTYRLLCGPLVIGFFYSVIMGVLFLLIARLTGENIVELLIRETSPVWITTIESIGEIFMIPLMAIYMILLYIDLRLNPLEKSDKVVDVC